MKENKTIFQIDQTRECEPATGAHSFSMNTHTNSEIHKQEASCGQRSSKNESLWIDTLRNSRVSCRGFDELPERVDVIVIGGGMAGILTAYELTKRGVDVIVVERDQVGGTCTSNTTAKITSLHGGNYSKIVRAHGEEAARIYYDASEDAIKEYQDIIKQLDIDCDFKLRNHILYSVEDEKKLKKEYDCMYHLGIPVEFTKSTQLPFTVKGGLAFTKQGQFHPLKFIANLVKRLKVYDHCQVTRIDSNGTVQINHKKEIQAKNVILATHYPIINSKGFYFAKLDQERSYVVALKQSKDFMIKDMYIDLDEKGHSFRRYKEYLIMGLGNHRTGDTKASDYYKQLEADAFRWFPDAMIAARWSNQDCMSEDYLPYIGIYSKSLPNFYVATGFNQWGMSNSMVAACTLADLITDKPNELEHVVRMDRHSLVGTGNRIVNGAISAMGLSKQILGLKKNEIKNIPNGKAGIVKIDQQTVGIYKDESGEIHAIDTKCPHLGCQLAFNSNDKTWDCPCHGSRFDIDGNLIEDPAQKDLKKVCHRKDRG